MTVRQEPRSRRVRGEALVEKVKQLIHEGNVRRILIKNDKGDTVVEIPVTAGVVLAVAAPVATAAGALGALATEWTIEVEHRDQPPTGGGVE